MTVITEGYQRSKQTYHYDDKQTSYYDSDNRRISEGAEGLLHVMVGGTDGGNHGRLGVSSQALLQQPERTGHKYEQ